VATVDELTLGGVESLPGPVESGGGKEVYRMAGLAARAG